MTVVGTMLEIDEQGGHIFVRSSDGRFWRYAPFADGENTLHEVSIEEMLGE